jgi:hypothetical protein
MRASICIVLLLLPTAALPQAPQITLFRSDGLLEWTNPAPEPAILIQSCTDLVTTASSNWSDVALTRQQHSVTVAPNRPMQFYRIVATDRPSTIRTMVVDQTIGGTTGQESCHLDLDRDGLSDLTFRCRGYGGGDPGYAVVCTAWRYDSDIYSHGDDYLSPTRFLVTPRSSGTAVFGTIDKWWETLAVLNCSGPPGFTNTNGRYSWFNVTNAYMPVRLVISNQHHYAWVRMSISSNYFTSVEHGVTNFPWLTWTIHDFAYESTPSRGIVSGQTE